MSTLALSGLSIACAENFAAHNPMFSSSLAVSCSSVPACAACRHYRGRGAFESMGAGIAMAPGDIAFKCNFATINNEVWQTLSLPWACCLVVCSALPVLHITGAPQFFTHLKYLLHTVSGCSTCSAYL
jgi:hypothetical protein